MLSKVLLAAPENKGFMIVEFIPGTFHRNGYQTPSEGGGDLNETPDLVMIQA